MSLQLHPKTLQRDHRCDAARSVKGKNAIAVDEAVQQVVTVRMQRHEVVVSLERPPPTANEAHARIVEVMELQLRACREPAAGRTHKRATESILLAEPSGPARKPCRGAEELRPVRVAHPCLPAIAHDSLATSDAGAA